MSRDDFAKMDKEAGVVTADAELVRSTPHPGAVIPGGTAEYRDQLVKKYHGGAEYRLQLVKKYHGGAESLVQRLQDSGTTDNESLMLALIDELVRETDNLLGNQLIATENGNVRDSSVISFKRLEGLEKAIKAVQSKQLLEKDSGIDVNSPSMVVIFTYFMGKVKEVFKKMELSDEQGDIFFQMLGEETENWKREIREEFEAMKSR